MTYALFLLVPVAAFIVFLAAEQAVAVLRDRHACRAETAARRFRAAARKAMAALPDVTDEAWGAFVSTHKLDEPQRKTS